MDDGRDPSFRIREANLDHHLETPAGDRTAAADASAQKVADRAAAPLPSRIRKASPSSTARRFGSIFGAAGDFQLTQAMNHLKGLPVITSGKSISAQAKPQ